jgi:hypothetical protein
MRPCGTSASSSHALTLCCLHAMRAQEFARASQAHQPLAAKATRVQAGIHEVRAASSWYAPPIASQDVHASRHRRQLPCPFPLSKAPLPVHCLQLTGDRCAVRRAQDTTASFRGIKYALTDSARRSVARHRPAPRLALAMPASPRSATSVGNPPCELSLGIAAQSTAPGHGTAGGNGFAFVSTRKCLARTRILSPLARRFRPAMSPSAPRRRPSVSCSRSCACLGLRVASELHCTVSKFFLSARLLDRAVYVCTVYARVYMFYTCTSCSYDLSQSRYHLSYTVY